MYHTIKTICCVGAQPKQRKKPRRGLLRSLFCCIRRPDRSDGNSSKGSSIPGGASVGSGDGRCSPPLSPNSNNGGQRYLLAPVRHQDMHRKCMVIDLDETLVHSSFKVCVQQFGGGGKGVNTP